VAVQPERDVSAQRRRKNYVIDRINAIKEEVGAIAAERKLIDEQERSNLPQNERRVIARRGSYLTFRRESLLAELKSLVAERKSINEAKRLSGEQTSSNVH
jgi:hypothetical protein